MPPDLLGTQLIVLKPAVVILAADLLTAELIALYALAVLLTPDLLGAELLVLQLPAVVLAPDLLTAELIVLCALAVLLPPDLLGAELLVLEPPVVLLAPDLLRSLLITLSPPVVFLAADLLSAQLLVLLPARVFLTSYLLGTLRLIATTTVVLLPPAFDLAAPGICRWIEGPLRAGLALCVGQADRLLPGGLLTSSLLPGSVLLRHLLSTHGLVGGAPGRFLRLPPVCGHRRVEHVHGDPSSFVGSPLRGLVSQVSLRLNSVM